MLSTAFHAYNLYSGVNAVTNVLQWPWGTRMPVQLLDPMTTVVRMAQLNFMPEGTLIRFRDNRILFDLPSMMQGTGRYIANLCGDSANKTDLHNLLPPLLRATEWFDPNGSHRMLFEYAVRGLHRLWRAYHAKAALQTCDAIQSYRRILLDSISGKNDVATQYRRVMEASICEPEVRVIASKRRPPRDDTERYDFAASISVHDVPVPANTTKDTMPVIDLSTFWSERQIQVVTLLVEEIRDHVKLKTDHTAVTKALECFLSGKEETLVKKIHHARTTV